MKQVKLIPKTNHGKNRINQHGETWNILEDRPTEFLLESLGRTFNLGGNRVHDGRRVDKINDRDFDVEILN